MNDPVSSQPVPSLDRVVVGTSTERALIEALDLAVYVCDTEGRIVAFNQAAATLWGRSPALGIDRWCGSARMFAVSGEPIAHDQCPLAIAVREARPVDGAEVLIERPDGSRRRVRAMPKPIYEKAGRLAGIVNTLLDVTEQHKAQTDQALLAAIVDSSDDAIISKTLTGRITSWNAGAQRIFGYTAKEMIGESVLKLIPPERRAEEDEILARLRRGERIEHFETKRMAKDRRLLDISLTVSPVRGPDGLLVGASKIARDVTMQKAAERELRRTESERREMLEAAVRERTEELDAAHRRLRLSERMASLGTLSAGLGHDLGNLLVPVRVSVEALNAATLPDDLREDVGQINTAVEYLQQLAGGLRLLAIDPHNEHSNEVLDARAWWSEASLIIKNTLPRGVALDADIEDGCLIRVSRPALTQIAFNLAQNAGEALRGRPDPRLRVSIHEHEGAVRVSVADNGRGMDDETRRRCLEPFFTTKTRAISTGLGLTVVAGLLQRAGGALDVESRPDQGTTFHLRLPRANAVDPDAAPLRAVVELADPRLRAFVIAELGAMLVDIAQPDTPGTPDLVISDELRAVNRFADTPRLVLFADMDQPPPRVTVVGADPRPSELRRVLRDAARGGALRGRAS